MCNKVFNFYFRPWDQIRVEKWHLFLESCWLNSMYNSRHSKQMICWDVIGQSLNMPNNIVPSGVKKRFFKNYISITWHSPIFLFCYYTPLEEDVALHFNILASPLPKDTCVPSVVEIGPVVLEKKLSMYFQYVAFIFLWQRAWPFIWTNLNHLQCFMSSMVDLDSVILKKLICLKIWMETWTDRQRDRQIDNKQFFCRA